MIPLRAACKNRHSRGNGNPEYCATHWKYWIPTGACPRIS